MLIGGSGSLTVDSEGRILVAANELCSDGLASCARITRFGSDGQIDAGFATPTIAVGEGFLGMKVLAAPDGLVYLGGLALTDAVTLNTGDTAPVVVRVEATGQLSPDFAEGGVQFLEQGESPFKSLLGLLGCSEEIVGEGTDTTRGGRWHHRHVEAAQKSSALDVRLVEAEEGRNQSVGTTFACDHGADVRDF